MSPTGERSSFTGFDLKQRGWGTPATFDASQVRAFEWNLLTVTGSSLPRFERKTTQHARARRGRPQHPVYRRCLACRPMTESVLLPLQAVSMRTRNRCRSRGNRHGWPGRLRCRRSCRGRGTGFLLRPRWLIMRRRARGLREPARGLAEHPHGFARADTWSEPRHLVSERVHGLSGALRAGPRHVLAPASLFLWSGSRTRAVSEHVSVTGLLDRRPMQLPT